MNVFGIGLPEMALIFVIALLVFGPKKLPEIGSSLGKAIRGFQDASREFENEFKRETSKAENKESVKMNAQLEPSSSEAETVSDAQAAEETTATRNEESKVNS
jgi:sec-independent protein translocase protein TatA